jgi:hypothetical protein
MLIVYNYLDIGSKKCFKNLLKKPNAAGSEGRDEAHGAAHFGASSLGGFGRGWLPRQG